MQEDIKDKLIKIIERDANEIKSVMSRNITQWTRNIQSHKDSISRERREIRQWERSKSESETYLKNLEEKGQEFLKEVAGKEIAKMFKIPEVDTFYMSPSAASVFYFETKPLFIEYEGSQIDIGRYQIRVCRSSGNDPYRSGGYVSGVGMDWHKGSYHHPFISGTDMCFGNITSDIQNSLRDGHLADVVQDIIFLLQCTSDDNGYIGWDDFLNGRVRYETKNTMRAWKSEETRRRNAQRQEERRAIMERDIWVPRAMDFLQRAAKHCTRGHTGRLRQMTTTEGLLSWTAINTGGISPTQLKREINQVIEFFGFDPGPFSQYMVNNLNAYRGFNSAIAFGILRFSDGQYRLITSLYGVDPEDDDVERVSRDEYSIYAPDAEEVEAKGYVERVVVADPDDQEPHLDQMERTEEQAYNYVSFNGLSSAWSPVSGASVEFPFVVRQTTASSQGLAGMTEMIYNQVYGEGGNEGQMSEVQPVPATNEDDL